MLEALLPREEILAVLIYGSFISSSVFRDIDVGVLTGGRVPYGELPCYEETLSDELSRIVGIPVDVRVIDYAPPWFRAKVLEGEVLLERSPGMVSIMRFIVKQIQRDSEAMIRTVLGKIA
ncbi:MAG: nucleotidyltransferase domain-containing protein [Candidatus Korarchaeota archaeon]|nr:nucleotidyltransferase domain-containing protein [Candidatus Korarchaeota archaeon]